MRGLASSRSTISNAEEEGHIERVEASQTDTAGLEQTLSAQRETFAEYSANVDAELGEAGARKDVLDSKRASRMSADLEPATLELYDRLLVARGGEALAVLDNCVCQACFIQVPPNLKVRLAQGKNLIQCSSCDRILYLA